MEDTRIIQLHVGYTSPVIVTGEGHYMLVDTGIRGRMEEITRQFRLYGIDPSKISLIVLTHSHFDHTGNLQELKDLTGAQVAVNRREAEWLRTGLMPIPRGTSFFSRVVVGLGDLLMPGYASPRPFEADILVDDYLDLANLGFEAQIIHTPGHTEGSQSVVVGRSLIAGDSFFNVRRLPVYPPFANDQQQLLETWRKVLELGIDTIYPGHGPRLNVEKAREAYWKKVSRIRKG